MPVGLFVWRLVMYVCVCEFWFVCVICVCVNFCVEEGAEACLNLFVVW